MTTAGQVVELARYRIPAGERALQAQRIDGRVAVIDLPDHYHASGYSGRLRRVRHLDAAPQSGAGSQHEMRRSPSAAWSRAASGIEKHARTNGRSGGST
jgi:hypothetical protein